MPSATARARAERPPPLQIPSRVELHAYRGNLSQGNAKRESSRTVLGAPRDIFSTASSSSVVDWAAQSIAVFLVLLYRHSRQAELGIGLRTGLDSGPGRTRLLNITFSETSVFSEVWTMVRTERIGSAARPFSSPRGPLPNVIFALREGSVGSDAQLLDEGAELFVELSIVDDELTLSVSNDPAVVASDWVRELGDQYALLARETTQSPETDLLDFNLVTARASAFLPDPRVHLDMPRHAPLVETILEWSRRTPKAAAIVYDGRSYSFAQLAELSFRVACALSTRGIVVGDTVAVTGDRSFALVGAMIGVFRSGGVLLMLDPKLPLQRRQTMIEQAGARMLVRVGSVRDAADDAGAGLPTLDYDAVGVESHPPPAAFSVELPTLDPLQPAYIFFTSGSTGTPKAVRGVHAGLAHFLDWQRETFAIGAGDRAAQLTALSFDVVLRDTFLALTAGATLCIPAEGDVLDPTRILRWLEANEITIIHIVPSLARMWLGHVPEGVTLNRLRRVFFAGEPLTDVLVQRWRNAFPGSFEIVNLYGPTETTLAKCFHRVPAKPQNGVQPIGQTLPQTQALILNGRRRVCGLNEVGEIAIRTPFRTLGYVGNPQANEKAFIRNPFRDDPGDLLYLTGDSGRYRDDGLLEILGRIDNQVKIRGVRIEPGEIEACLGRHPTVRDTVVVAREDDAGDKFLVAYVVPAAAAADEPAAKAIEGYRRFLRDRLPENMVPSAFMRLKALPLNANGKVDKRALPAVDRTALSSTGFAQPQGDLQQKLAAAWCRVLDLPRVGIDDNFFDIGGHSLLAVQLVRTIENDFGVACSLPDLFRAPTIRGLSACLANGNAESQGPFLLPLQPEGSAPALFCICGIHLYQELADHFAPDVPVYGIFLPSEERLYDADAEESSTVMSVEGLAAGYVEAVRARQPHGPYFLAGVSFGGVLAYEVAQQLVDAGEEVAFLAMLDSMLPRALKRDWVRWAWEHLRQVRQRGWREPTRKVWRRLKGDRSNATHLATPVDESERLAEIRQTIYKKATRRYVPRPYGSFAMLVRAEDKGFFESDVADPTYGWGALVPQLRTCDVPGDHLSILKKPNVAILAKQLHLHLHAR